MRPPVLAKSTWVEVWSFVAIGALAMGYRQLMLVALVFAVISALQQVAEAVRPQVPARPWSRAAR